MLTRRMKVAMGWKRSKRLNIKLRQTQETRRCTMKKAKRLLKTKYSESIDWTRWINRTSTWRTRLIHLGIIAASNQISRALSLASISRRIYQLIISSSSSSRWQSTDKVDSFSWLQTVCSWWMTQRERAKLWNAKRYSLRMLKSLQILDPCSSRACYLCTLIPTCSQLLLTHLRTSSFNM